jgi:hypothetical protein
MTACDWEIIECGECSALTNLEAEIQADVEAWAIDKLWQWTGERFGLCEVTYRDDSDECCTLRRMYPCPTTTIRLPGPIAEPISAIIDGEELGPEAFRVDDELYLVRIDGGRFRSPWEITFFQGEVVPPGGGLVAGILACEYAKALCNDNSCRLPKRVTTITRQGLTMAMLDNFLDLEKGYTGIREIDDWVTTQNKPKRPSLVTSPDVPRYRKTTWEYASS